MTSRAPPLRDVDHALEHRPRVKGAESRKGRAPCDSTAGVRIGLALPQYDFSVAGESPLSWETLSGYARRADETGFDSLWLSDHLFFDIGKYGGSPEPAGAYEPIVDAGGAVARGEARPPRNARALRSAAPGDGPGQGARVARPRDRRTPRRRARRRVGTSRSTPRSAWTSRRPESGWPAWPKR